MARRNLVVALMVVAVAMSGCLSYESSHSYESPDGCWMFCGGDTSYSYSAFIWFPMAMVLLLVAGIVIAVVAATNSGSQQQVIIKTDEKD